VFRLIFLVVGQVVYPTLAILQEAPNGAVRLEVEPSNTPATIIIVAVHLCMEVVVAALVEDYTHTVVVVFLALEMGKLVDHHTVWLAELEALLSFVVVGLLAEMGHHYHQVLALVAAVVVVGKLAQMAVTAVLLAAEAEAEEKVKVLAVLVLAAMAVRVV
jgi:hypothetical protein